MQHLKLISCKVFYREISYFAATSKNYTDVTYLRQRLHEYPSKLNKALQDEIDLVDSGKDVHTNYPPYDADFDAILIGFGLCSNSIENLSSCKYPLVIPRAHDCITLFLGSKEQYKDYFFNHKGTYWYNAGWIENASMPGPEQHEAALKKYRAKYGASADKMVTASEEWRKGYQSLAFIRWNEFDTSRFEQFARKCAAYAGWEYSALQGDSTLMRDFIEGNWDEERFLVVPPGKKIALTYDEKIITYD